MAAPANKTIADLNGKWYMNKTLSSPIEAGLALQGVSWVARKAVSVASLTLVVNQFVAPPSPPAEPSATPVTHIVIDQTGTGGMKGTTEKRCLDNVYREHSDWLFGNVRGRTQFLPNEEITDEFLKSGWLEGEEEKTGPNGTSHLISYVENNERGWTATQIWGFKIINGERRYVRNVVIAKGSERIELQLVYDFVPE
ncbi:hypothetical protein B0J18DRAFT_248045 [Chaetomium sp. MPI-SDFR-AT-0129]|nr:hypothetical protein B0J18DRAFT_248045 [Chaetomium sp. MPI-SDFR-AT-0129]